MSREIIQTILETKFPKNISTAYENEIFKMCERLKISYEKYAYEKVGEIMETDDKDARKKIATDIVNDRSEIYNSSIYKPFDEQKSIDNERIINPPTIQKSLYKCKHCHSDKTWSYQHQTRSGDEGMTTFINCSECGKRYKF